MAAIVSFSEGRVACGPCAGLCARPRIRRGDKNSILPPWQRSICCTCAPFFEGRPQKKKTPSCDWFRYSCAFPRARVSFAYSMRALVRALRRRARPTSTRERRASARAYAIPTCSSRARASPSTPRAAVCAAHPPDSSRVVDEKVKPSPAETATCASQSTTDAPNERTRGTPRGVPTISTCIRVTPTTSRVRFRSARISATAQCVGSDRVSVMRNARCARPDAQSMPVARALGIIRASFVTLPSR